MKKYNHGYTNHEAKRLTNQSNTLNQLLHHDSRWKKGSVILEASCGTGAQTKILSQLNPDCQFISVDISEESLEIAKNTISSLGITNVRFQHCDIFKIPYEDEFFDNVFICFVLEHLQNYQNALAEIKRVLKKKGTIIVIEGDHGSTYFHPESEKAKQAIECQIKLQKINGGDTNIGRKLFPILRRAEFKKIKVSPRMVYVDGSKPDLIEGFTKNTFIAMIEGVKDEVVEKRLMNAQDFDTGIRDLYRSANQDGVFCYTFFKAIGVK